MNPLTRRIVAVAWALFITLPLAAFAIGIRPASNENRPPTPYPEFGPLSAFDSDTYEVLDDYFADRLPQ